MDVKILIMSLLKSFGITIAAKERIAQLLFSNYIEVEFVEVESLDSTDRGVGWCY